MLFYTKRLEWILEFIPIDNVQTLAFMVWCAELHTNRASIFGGPEA